MRVAILLATLLTTGVSAVAGAISVTSPDRAQTFAYGEMIWHQLYLERTVGALRRGSRSVICFTSAATNRAGTNRSTFAFQASNWIPHDGLDPVRRR